MHGFYMINIYFKLTNLHNMVNTVTVDTEKDLN